MIDFGIEFVKAEVNASSSIVAFHTAVQLRLAASLNCDDCESVAPSTQHAKDESEGLTSFGEINYTK